MPNAPASVTSISPYNFNTRPFTNGFGHRGPFKGCRGCGYGYGGYGYGYTVPYYYLYPAYDPGYDTSGGGGGPYLYSGPPQGQAAPSEQTLHVVVETAPPKPVYPQDDAAQETPLAPAASTQGDVKPGVPTILIYRDGHKQEVTNYAIMGQTLYVFSDRTKKIALADLDVPATIKANDEQGIEFQVPKVKQNSKPAKSTIVPQQNPPAESPNPPSSVATVSP